nr:MAG TPA: hypothetical protein [Bacteriophage sp.]
MTLLLGRPGLDGIQTKILTRKYYSLLLLLQILDL